MQFFCDHCGKWTEDETTEAEARALYEASYPEALDWPVVSICDNCNAVFKARFASLPDSVKAEMKAWAQAEARKAE